MDSKIADRVRGYLSNRVEPSPVDAIHGMWRAFCGPPSTGRVLEQLTRDLEEEVEERRLTNRAKRFCRVFMACPKNKRTRIFGRPAGKHEES